MESPIFHLPNVVHEKSSEVKDFDGPLDLILYLLKVNKMEINEIRISLILDQYMEWIRKRQELDLEVASEFMIMAAQLMYIKTRTVLSLDENEDNAEMEELIDSLERKKREDTYLQIKDAASELQERYEIGKNYITKQPEIFPKSETKFITYSSEDLKEAMLSVLTRSERRMPPPLKAFQGIVGKEPYPVSKKSEEIIRKLIRNGITRFKALFRGSRTRSEIVATFLAVLELCKSHRVWLAGTEKDCTIVYTPTKSSGEEGNPDEEQGGEEEWN